MSGEEQTPKLTIDPIKGLDLYHVLEPLAVSHDLDDERIKAMSERCVTPERVEGVAMCITHEFKKKALRSRLVSMAVVLVFAALFFALVADIWMLYTGENADSGLFPANGRILLPLPLLALLIIESIRRSHWKQYEYEYELANQKLADIVKLNRDDDSQNSNEPAPTSAVDKKND
jgi:hypothetical protein